MKQENIKNPSKVSQCEEINEVKNNLDLYL